MLAGAQSLGHAEAEAVAVHEGLRVMGYSMLIVFERQERVNAVREALGLRTSGLHGIRRREGAMPRSRARSASM